MAQFTFTNIDLNDVVRTATNINIVATDFIISGAKTIALKKSGKLTVRDSDDAEATSLLGTRVYDTVTLGGDASNNVYFDLAGNEQSYEQLTLHQAVLDVTQQKNIVSTQIEGRNGTIKEYLSDGDYSITLTGGVSGTYENGNWINAGNKFPLAAVKQLVNICKAGVSIPVKSTFLNDIFQVSNVVITNYRFYQREGIRNIQMFEISFLSDRTDDLEYTADQLENENYLSQLLG